MAFSQVQLDALESAIAEGTLTVKYADKLVTYRSLDEMIRIRELIRQSMGGPGFVSRIYPVVSKGLD